MRLRRGDFNHRLNGLNGWELDGELTLIFHFSLFTFHFAEGDCNRLHRL